MEEYIELKQIERQLILYDVFRSLDEVTYGDINYALKEINARTLQRDIKDLKMAGLINVKYSTKRQAYVIKESENEEVSLLAAQSETKKKHIERLKRLADCLSLVDSMEPVKEYFELFPNATERMRIRDFETLRRIGLEAGYDKDFESYVVSMDYVNAYDGYGVQIKNGKLIRYR